MSKVTEQQIQDWIENPVTEELARLAEQELEEIENTPITDTLVYGDPAKTQENLVELESRSVMFSDLVTFLKGDWSYFEEEEEKDEDIF